MNNEVVSLKKNSVLSELRGKCVKVKMNMMECYPVYRVTVLFIGNLDTQGNSHYEILSENGSFIHFSDINILFVDAENLTITITQN